MKLSYIALVCFLLSHFTSFSQKKESLKGNKIPETKTVEITPYKILEVDQNFEILLVQQEEPRVRIDADSNLHDFITVKVDAEKLHIRSSVTFSRFKKLYVEVGYNKELAQIIANDKAVIRGNTALVTDRTELTVNDNAEVELHFRSDFVEVKANGKSRTTTSIEAQNIVFTLKDDSKVSGEAITESLNIQMDQKSELTLSGSAQKSNYFINGSCKYYGGQLVAGQTLINITGKSECFLNTTDKLKVNAIDESETHILGNPLIELEAFSNEATLFKTEKTSSNGFKNIFSK